VALFAFARLTADRGRVYSEQRRAKTRLMQLLMLLR